MVPLIITLTYFLAAGTFALPFDLLGFPQNLMPSLVTRQKDPTPQYTAVENAAAAAGTTLRNGEWHYFRLCSHLAEKAPENHLQEKTGCRHHLIVVGKVIKGGIFRRRPQFKGRMYHVKPTDGKFMWLWIWHPYLVFDSQTISYGGKTTSEKAKRARLASLSKFCVSGVFQQQR
ncbi:hypothetical protein CSHISOI_09442 [Colletotrichum shisoi]|uniref:Uncharacterized protein n=1 Tax=Colletotrichum shisoi TaxID=2078593 RepID=A0A5Q4BH30_9PEZI|nr:hypothetical protein CSHISOI_09442 [Colletotrichum shisoi]